MDVKIKQIEIFRDDFNEKKRYFISVNYEIAEPGWKDNGFYQAFDAGISKIATGVNSGGKFIEFKNNRSDLYWKNRLAQVQSKRDHCNKGSRRWKRYNWKFVMMKRKCTNQIRDFQHKLSKKIVENTKANTIIVGDLNIKKMVRHKKGTDNAIKTKVQKTLNHSIQNTGSMGRFIQFLTYKARKLGKKVIKIDESYTTQTCCICGKREKKTLSQRVINCDCGNQLDRDVNSAVNIMLKFLENRETFGCLSKNPLVDAVSFLETIKEGIFCDELPHSEYTSEGLAGSPSLQ